VVEAGGERDAVGGASPVTPVAAAAPVAACVASWTGAPRWWILGRPRRRRRGRETGSPLVKHQEKKSQEVEKEIWSTAAVTGSATAAR
jgi:hypothetical protein